MAVSYYDSNGDPWLAPSKASTKKSSVAGSVRSKRSNSVSRASRASRASNASKGLSLHSRRSQSIADDMSVAKKSMASRMTELTTESQRQYIEQLEKTLQAERKRRIEAEALLQS